MKYALEKVKVVDLASYIAGAYCSGLLADLGADVIKLEAPAGDPFRGLGGGFQVWNRGKRSICVDLRTDEGKDILHQLVRPADVLVENYRPGVVGRLGADYHTLRRINPEIIYCSVSGYGQTGPYVKKPGFDPLLQARSGAMSHQGGQGKPPVFLVLAISDYGAAILGAYGVAMALFARARTGKGTRVETSLLNAAMGTQSGRFILSPNMSNGAAPEDAFGPGPTYRIYPTTDGWIFLGVKKDEEWSRLVRVLGRQDLDEDSRFDIEAKRVQASTELTSILAEAFATESSARWLERLEAAGVPCSPVNYFADLFDHPQVRRNGLVVEHDSPDAGPVRQLGVPVMLSKTPGIARGPAPALGQHTDKVLADLGYSPDDIQELRRKRVVK